MNIQALRGTVDVLPKETVRWHDIERKSRTLFSVFGYQEIRTPIIEEAALFMRAVGETTDIVQKEMYVFTDKGNRQICLRPEGTAGIVRAYLERGLGHSEGLVRLFYMGPMFRSERPQEGRRRQFHQIGAEAIGSASPWVEVELLQLLDQLLREFGVKDCQLEVNNLGCLNDRTKLTQSLQRELTPLRQKFCEDCQIRFGRNIFRILDCKKPSCQELVKEKVRDLVQEQICPSCQDHFKKVLEGLEEIGIAYRMTPYLVRGLDYYSGTVFELTSVQLGAQGTLAAGGRYDHLVEELGGHETPAIGWALGMERLLMILDKGVSDEQNYESTPEVFIVIPNESLRLEGFKLLSRLRQTRIPTLMDLEEKSLKGQLRMANKKGVPYVLLLGDEEWRREEIVLKDMRKGVQELIPKQKVIEIINSKIHEADTLLR